jgi:putative addiction module killer protein
MIEVHQTEEFSKWLHALRDRQARVRVQLRIDRLQLGNDVKPAGDGVSELRIDYGPGYRIYYVHRGPKKAVLLVGGDKSTQDADIKNAKKLAKQL